MLARLLVNARARLDALTPAQGLFLLAPLLGEVVSGYLSPLNVLNPLILVITVIPYGCGALVVRELVVRWGKGWVSLVLLALAFGLLFEGIVTRVIFNPNWQDLGALAEYSHVHGVNWTLAVGIVHFQAAIAIISAILLANIIYADQRAESWISTRTLAICAAVLPGWTLVIAIFEPFVPPVEAALGLAVLIVVLGGLALVIPAHVFRRRWQPWPVWAFVLIGATGMTLIMLGTYVLPEVESLRPPLEVTFGGLLALMAVELGALTLANNGGATWTDRHRLALVIGWLAFFVVFSFLQDLEGVAGRSLVSVATVWQLRRLWQGVPAKGDRQALDSATP